MGIRYKTVNPVRQIHIDYESLPEDYREDAYTHALTHGLNVDYGDGDGLVRLHGEITDDSPEWIQYIWNSLPYMAQQDYIREELEMYIYIYQ